MSEVIVRIDTLNEAPQGCGQCDPLLMTVCAVKHEQPIEKMVLRVGRPDWCPILGVLPQNAVPVVRCGECKSVYKEDDHEYWCRARGFPMMLVAPEEYCSRGERRTDGG